MKRCVRRKEVVRAHALAHAFRHPAILQNGRPLQVHSSPLVSVEMNKIGDDYRRLLGDYFPSTIIAHIPRIEYPWCSFVMLPTSAEATTVTYTYIQPFPSRGQVITMPPPVDGRLTGVCLSFVFSLCGIRFLSLLGKQKIGWQQDAQVSAAAMTHSELNRNIFDNTHDKK